MSLRFISETKTVNGIIETTNSAIYYNTLKDEYLNEIATILVPEKRREVSSRIRQMEGSKYSVYLTAEGVPCAMEHDDSGEIGELNFKNKRLIDYDGCYSMPKEIIKLVRKLGFTVPRDME